MLKSQDLLVNFALPQKVWCTELHLCLGLSEEQICSKNARRIHPSFSVHVADTELIYTSI